MRIRHRFRAYTADGGELGPLPKIADWNYGLPFNDLSSMNLNLRDGDPGVNFLYSPAEVAVETSIDGLNWTEKPNSRFLRIKRNLNAVGEDGIRKYTMPGYGWLLNKMVQMKTTGLNADGKRPFNAVPAGAIMKTLLDECLAYSGTKMTYSFTASVDSAGRPWTKNASIAYEPGLSLWTILSNLTDQGLCDWNFTGRTLNLYVADTTLNVSRDLTLQKGVDITGMPVDGSLEDVAHSVLAVGDGGKKVLREGGTAPAFWGKWVTFISQGGVNDSATMNLMADNELLANGAEALQLTAEMPYNRSNFDPLYDFNPGDYFSIKDDYNVLQNYRCRGINFTRDGQGARRVDLIINTRLVEKSIRNARKTNGITGGAKIKGSGSPATPPAAASRKPAIPTSLVLTSEAYIASTGVLNGGARSTVTASYLATSTDVNGVSLEISAYNFRCRKVALVNNVLTAISKWSDAGQTADLSYTIDMLEPRVMYEFQMRAISDSGTPSGWSTGVTITTADDVTGPPKPSAPVVTTRLGTVTVTWDGYTSDHSVMPKDLTYCELWQVGTDTRLVGTNGRSVRNPWVLFDVVIGQTYSYFIRAYDQSGNASPDSDQVSIKVTGIMSDPGAAMDIQNNITVPAPAGLTKTTYSPNAPTASTPGSNIGDTWWQYVAGQLVGNWRWDIIGSGDPVWISQSLTNAVIATIDAGKINTGTLLAARIATESITADKLVAGTIDATRLSATAIDGKVITGATVRTSAGTNRIMMYSNASDSYLVTGTRQIGVAGTTGWAFVGSSGLANCTDSDGDVIFSVSPGAGTVSLSNVTLKTSKTDSGARLMIEPNGRQRVYLADSTLFFDLNPSLTTGRNLILKGGMEAYGFNIGANAVYGSLSGDSAGTYLTANGSDPLNLMGAAVRSATIRDSAITTAASQVLITNATGTMGYPSSSRRYKVNIGDFKTDKSILQAQPREWFDKGEAELIAETMSREAAGETVDWNHDELNFPVLEKNVGFVSEEIAEIGLERFVMKDLRPGQEGQLRGIHYDRLWIPLLPIVREHDEDIAALKEEIAALRKELQK